MRYNNKVRGWRVSLIKGAVKELLERSDAIKHVRTGLHQAGGKKRKKNEKVDEKKVVAADRKKNVRTVCRTRVTIAQWMASPPQSERTYHFIISRMLARCVH